MCGVFHLLFFQYCIFPYLLWILLSQFCLYFLSSLTTHYFNLTNSQPVPSSLLNPAVIPGFPFTSHPLTQPLKKSQSALTSSAFLATQIPEIHRREERVAKAVRGSCLRIACPVKSCPVPALRFHSGQMIWPDLGSKIWDKEQGESTERGTCNPQGGKLMPQSHINLQGKMALWEVVLPKPPLSQAFPVSVTQVSPGKQNTSKDYIAKIHSFNSWDNAKWDTLCIVSRDIQSQRH